MDTINKEELLRFANIFDNAGQVFLGGLVISPFFSLVDKIITLVVVFIGLVMTGFCWFISWKFTKLMSK